MKYATLLIISSLLFTSTSCKSQKGKTNPNNKEASISEEENSRLIIRFISPGNGIDSKKLAQLKTYLRTEYPDITYQTTSWGREGEKDLCFNLSEVKPEQQKEIIIDLKSKFGNNPRINILENAKCN